MLQSIKHCISDEELLYGESQKTSMNLSLLLTLLSKESRLIDEECSKKILYCEPTVVLLEFVPISSKFSLNS